LTHQLLDSTHTMGGEFMITFFNRKELLMSYNFRQVDNLREILQANRIDYFVKVSGPRSAASIGTGRSRMYSFGHDRNLERYIVYVHKHDWEYGMHLLRKL